jgi:hypothetical protein
MVWTMRLLMVSALIAASAAVPGLLAGSEAAEEPHHQVVLAAATGSAVTTWPDYDQSVGRFAVRLGATTQGLSVTASSDDPGATVSVNGQPAANGSPHIVEDLGPGEEVNVQITDSGGTSNQSWIVLPSRFPTLTATGPHPDLGAGEVFLTLSSFVAPPFTTVVDSRGVPVVVLAQAGSDFKASASRPHHYSIALSTDAGGDRIVELDERFEEVRSHRLAGDKATSTDFHDSTLFPDGSALLMGYDFLNRDGGLWIDAIIQRLDPAGEAAWTWNSKDHVDGAEGLVDRTPHDYAHINSLQELGSGDVVASFRNLSQVMLIAGSEHDGFARGDVIWRLGGLRNDFEFVDDPYGGPCAQHAAQVLPNGHLMIFDNGSRRDESGPIAAQTADMCPDPEAPDGARVARPQSRVTEYVLDTTTTPPTATLVWSHVPTGRYAPFAGNAQRLPNGNTLAGWSQSETPSGTAPVATEVTVGGDEIWSLMAGGHFSYRAFKHAAPDRLEPTVTITSPSGGATLEPGEAVPTAFSCRDTGGSNLDECSATLDGSPIEHGDPLPTGSGTHELAIRATDRAGNAAVSSLTYTVTAPPPSPSPSPSPTPSPTSSPSPTATPAPTVEPRPRADAMIRKPGGRWKGRDVLSTDGQAIALRTRTGLPVRAQVRIRNIGDAAARLVANGTVLRRGVELRWYTGGRDVTRRIEAGTFRTPRLGPGQSVRLVLVVEPHASGVAKVIRLAARAPGDTTRDVVRARVRVVR